IVVNIRLTELGEQTLDVLQPVYGDQLSQVNATLSRETAQLMLQEVYNMYAELDEPMPQYIEKMDVTRIKDGKVNETIRRLGNLQIRLMDKIDGYSAATV